MEPVRKTIKLCKYWGSCREQMAQLCYKVQIFLKEVIAQLSVILGYNNL